MSRSDDLSKDERRRLETLQKEWGKTGCTTTLCVSDLRLLLTHDPEVRHLLIRAIAGDRDAMPASDAAPADVPALADDAPIDQLTRQRDALQSALAKAKGEQAALKKTG